MSDAARRFRPLQSARGQTAVPASLGATGRMPAGPGGAVETEEGDMRSAQTLLFATTLLLGGLLLATPASSKGRGLHGHTNAASVKQACGKDLQSGGGAFGCTKCDGEGCTDWSCNNSGQGRQGCWVEPVGKIVPGGGKGKKGIGNSVKGVKSVGTRGGKRNVGTGAGGARPTGVGVRAGTTRDHRRGGGSTTSSAQGGVLVDGREGKVTTSRGCLGRRPGGGCRPPSAWHYDWRNPKNTVRDHRSK